MAEIHLFCFIFTLCKVEITISLRSSLCVFCHYHSGAVHGEISFKGV